MSGKVGSPGPGEPSGDGGLSGPVEQWLMTGVDAAPATTRTRCTGAQRTYPQDSLTTQLWRLSTSLRSGHSARPYAYAQIHSPQWNSRSCPSY